MAPVVIICAVLVAGLVFYAMHRSKPSRLKLSANLLKLFSFSIEVESQDSPKYRAPAGVDGGSSKSGDDPTSPG
jgi:hypothetical protein